MKKDQDHPADAAALRRRAEERLREKQGGQKSEVSGQCTTDDMARLVHELQVHQIELEMQNEELRQAHAQVETFLAQYTDLYNFAPMGYLTLDREGAIRQVNLTGALLLGVERSRLMNRRLGLFVAEDDRRAFSDFLQNVFASQTKESCEVTLLKEGSQPLVVQIEGTRSVDGQECRAVVQDITERKQAEEEMRNSDAEYRTLFEHNADGILIADLETKIFKFVNPVACRMFEYPENELKTIGVSNIHPKEALPHVAAEFEAQARGEKTLAVDLPCLRKDGTIFYADVNATTITLDRRPCLVGFFRDVTERKRLEAQFRQAQKLEGVGRLAGGVAHDFNNLLTGILGYCDLVLTELPEGDRRREDVTGIRQCGERAAALTRQLLAFSRKQVLIPQILDLNTVVARLESLLHRLIGEDAELTFVPASNLGPVRADPGQIEQVIVNLVINARDAMPQGGKLTIETFNVNLDEEYAQQHVAVHPGSYVMLTVSDSGSGMDAETLSHLFEPFFTTKELDKGTGLGLSTVYGIIKQSGGDIQIYSELGHGSTFKIYLPRVSENVPVATVAQETIKAFRGTGTILVVEDEPVVRDMAARMLEKGGYKVRLAANGMEALNLYRQHGSEISLVMTDMVMPNMGGKDLADQLHRLCPGVKILYTSGYTDDAIMQHAVLEPGTPFIQKPYTMEDLLAKVRKTSAMSSI